MGACVCLSSLVVSMDDPCRWGLCMGTGAQHWVPWEQAWHGTGRLASQVVIQHFSCLHAASVSPLC